MRGEIPRRRIAVAGSGASATALIATLTGFTSDLEIFCFDDHPLGSSLAFAGDSSLGICNTSSAANAGYLRRIGGATDIGTQDDSTAGVDEFLPRDVVGGDIAAAAARLRREEGVVIHEQLGPVVRVDRTGESLCVTGTTTRVGELSALYLCRGLTEPHVPAELRARFSRLGVGPDEMIESPYPLDARVGDITGRTVVVIGSGLSAVEAAVTLATAGCEVVLASRTGTLPSVRRTLPDDPDLARWFVERIQNSSPRSDEQMTRLLAGCFTDLGAGLPGPGGPVGTTADIITRLDREIDECWSVGHWSRPIIPMCRAVNSLPNHCEIARRAVESPLLRRHTNAMSLTAATALAAALRQGTIRTTSIDAVFSDDRLGRPRSRPWCPERVDTVVFACGWRPPVVPDGASGVPWTTDPAATWGAAAHVIPIGTEARGRIAVPNALFALDQQLRALDRVPTPS